jgi:flagellar hook-basal body complex protein FliE
MSIESIVDATRAGLAYERLRLDAASRNIASANMPIPADAKRRQKPDGYDVAVHDVMISMEEARMSLMFMVEVRNRAVEAYQELMRMQL